MVVSRYFVTRQIAVTSPTSLFLDRRINSEVLQRFAKNTWLYKPLVISEFFPNNSCAQILILQKSNNAISPSGSLSFSELFLWILSPLFSLINFLKAFLFGSPDQPRGAHNPAVRKLENMSQSQQPK